MDLIMFLFLSGVWIINAYRDGKRILAGKSISHWANVAVRLAFTGLIIYAHYNTFGSIAHALSLAAVSWIFGWILFDILLSLQLMRGKTWGYVGTTALTDKVTEEFHIQLKFGLLILTSIIYSHFAYNVYIDESKHTTRNEKVHLARPVIIPNTYFYMPVDKSPNRKRRRDSES
jgi:hypothetical protein